MVSPRTRSAIRSPPICEGVASPDIMLSNASEASWRDSVAPVATLAMMARKSLIGQFVKGVAPVTWLKAFWLTEMPMSFWSAGIVLPDQFVGLPRRAASR